MANLTRSLLPAGGTALLIVCLASLWRPSSSDERCVDGPPAMVVEALERSEAKRAVAAAVREGRLTLTEAAARFRAINATAPPAEMVAFRLSYPGDSDEERYRRAVIQYVTVSLEDRPEEARAIQVRLEAGL